MRTRLCLFLCLLVAYVAQAQAPAALSYQAVLRNASNQALPLQQVSTRIQIHQGSETGAIVYEETHNSSTNENGLISLVIGAGTNTTGSVAAIDWSSGPYFVSSETDPDGGSNYSLTGSSELLSVPYALYSNQSGSSLPGPQGESGPAGPQGEPGLPGPIGPAGASACEVVSNGNLAVIYTNQNAYGYSQSQSSIGTNYNVGGFVSTTLNGNVLGNVASELQVALWTGSDAYAFYQTQSSLGNPPNLNTGAWVSTSISGTPLGGISNSMNLVIYTSTSAYGLSQARSTNGEPPNLTAASWTAIELSGTFIKAVSTSRSILILTSTHVYAFNQSQGTLGSEPNENIGNWVSSTLAGNPVDVVPSK